MPAATVEAQPPHPRHARARPGHPRLCRGHAARQQDARARPRSAPAARKAWMAGTSPAMTERGARTRRRCRRQPSRHSRPHPRHARARPGHPRLCRGRAPPSQHARARRAARLAARKAWIAGASPAMTERRARTRSNAGGNRRGTTAPPASCPGPARASTPLAGPRTAVRRTRGHARAARLRRARRGWPRQARR
jgi:hypothetical protein